VSEYQYYEFLALDKALTSRQREALRQLSTRAEITATLTFVAVGLVPASARNRARRPATRRP
jgi:hypothetical protein